MRLIRTGNLIINADHIVEAIYRADEARLELVYAVTDSDERSDYDGNHVSEKHEPYCRTLTKTEAESVWNKLIELCD